MLLLALVLVFALAACAAGNKSTEGSDNTAPSQNTAEQPKAPEESKTPEGSQDLNTSEIPSESGTESQQPGETPDAAADSEDSLPDQESEGSKILVAYFSGKTLVAFCTSASSGFGRSDSALRSAADSATWLDGHRFSAGSDADDVLAWANGLGIN